MAKHSISISYPPYAHPDTEQVRRTFAELGWTVTYYGIGSSNLERDAIDVESDERPLDHPTLLATLRGLDIPLVEDPFNYTSISGDVSMARQSVKWEPGRGADIEDVHLEILDVRPHGSFEWQDRFVPRLGVRCIVFPRGNDPLKFPVCIDVRALREDGQPISRLAILGGPVWQAGETTFEVPMDEPVDTIQLLVRILDLHRAGEVLFRSVPVTSSPIC
jgi:hypothetical protein